MNKCPKGCLVLPMHGEHFCTNCGAELVYEGWPHCFACNRKMEPRSQFCGGCGRKDERVR